MSKIITALALIFAVTAMGLLYIYEAERERADALSKLVLYPPCNSPADKNEELNELPNRIVVNVVCDAKNEHDVDSTESVLAKEYIINGESIDIGDAKTLADKIRQACLSAKEADYKEFHVEIRADHRVEFEAVQNVLKAATRTDIRGINIKMNITALTSTKGP